MIIFILCMLNAFLSYYLSLNKVVLLPCMLVHMHDSIDFFVIIYNLVHRFLTQDMNN